MFSSLRSSCVAGALALAAFPCAAEAQKSQVGALEVAVKKSSSFDAATDSIVRVYGQSHALVIGINSYSGQWERRSSAISDAQAVAASLKTLGFDVDQIMDPDRETLNKAFERFLRGPGSSRSSRLVIWFSGQAVTRSGKAHLLPKTSQDGRRGSDLDRHAVPLDRISRHLQEARAKHVLGAFDACFSHSGFTMANSAPLQSITSRTVEPVRQIITSCDANQTVSDSGKFRQLFLDALMGRAPAANLNKDDYLTGTELGLFLADRLSSLTENLQTPTFGKIRYAGLDQGDTVFRFPSQPIAIPQRSAHSSAPPQSSREPEPRLVEKIQRRLSILGCYTGGIDGRWGSGTSRAITEVNKKRNLKPPLLTTKPDQGTLDRLRDMSGNVCTVVAKLPSKPERPKSTRKSRSDAAAARAARRAARKKRSKKVSKGPSFFGSGGSVSKSRRKGVTIGVGF